jgi:prepilin-type processing-associated H-X9-DG protein
MICPEAQDPVPFNQVPAGGIAGAGTATNSWSGVHQTSVVGIRIDSSKPNNTSDATRKGYRVGSYGFNGNVHYGKRPAGPTYPAKFGYNISSVRPSAEVPVFYDCVWIESAAFTPGSRLSPAQPPPNLTGNAVPSATTDNTKGHWRFLIARHGRAINVAFADGSARRVPLEDTFMLKWTPFWDPYPLKNLPKK